MVTLKIGSSELPLAQATPHWITQQIVGRQADRVSVCVRVDIRVSGANMLLATPQCMGGGGWRQPTPLEERIHDLWKRHGLDRTDFAPGQVVSFAEQLRRLLD